MRLLRPLFLALATFGSAASAGATTVGLLLPDSTSEPASRAAHAAQASADDKGWKIETRDDGAVSGAGLADLVRRRVDALVLVMLRPEAHPAEAEAARKAGIPIITILAGASPLSSFDVAVNQYAVGADIGAYLLGSMGYAGQLIVLRADSDPAARARARVVEVMLQDAPGVHVLDTVQRAAGAGWEAAFRRDLDRSLQAAGAGPVSLWAAGDEMALAAEAELKAKGYDRAHATIVSVGGSQPTFGRIRDSAGLIAATEAVPYELLGEAALDLIDDLLSGSPHDQIAVGPYLVIDPVLVDRANVPAEDELPW